jgi:hypothetical protein
MASLKYVHASMPTHDPDQLACPRIIDRHGKVRRYVRRHGRRVPLPGLPGSVEFTAAYARALGEAAAPAEIGASHTLPGSINAMVVGYLGSVVFHNLAPASQAQHRRSSKNCGMRMATSAW